MRRDTYLNRRQKVRGSILLLTLFFLVLISLFAVAFWKIVPVELHSAQRHKDDTRAYYAADAGVVDTIGWLGAATIAGNVDQLFADNGVLNATGDRVITRTGDLGGVRWSTTITPGPGTYGYHDTSSPNPIRVYKLEATASLAGKKYRSVSAWISQDSFAKRNWMVGQGAQGNALNLNFATFRLGGDYHTNDYLRFNIPNSNFWSNTQAAVGGTMSSAVSYASNTADGVIYNSWAESLLPYNPSNGASISGRYEKISAAGRSGIQTGIGTLSLPANTDSVAFGVWGGTPPAIGTQPANTAMFGSSSVNLRINGATPGSEARNGLYIEGDVGQIDLDLVNNNQRMRILQGTNRVEVTFVTNSATAFTIPAGSRVNGSIISSSQNYLGNQNNNQGWTIVKKSNANEYVVYKEQTNGAVFIAGNVNGIRGTTKGRRTVATITGEGNSGADDRRIKITGELLYAGTPRGQVPTSSNDQLGLISYAVKMASSQATAAPSGSNNQDGRMWPTRSSTSSSNPIYLYCSIFAGRNNDSRANIATALDDAGGFGSESATDQGLGAGHMTMYGSLTEGVRLIKGQFNTQTSQGISGYSYSFLEDPNLETMQPPFFPTLPKYKVISWEEKSVFAY